QLPSAAAQLGEQLVDDVVAGAVASGGELQVLGNGEPGEHLPVLGHVAHATGDDAMGALLVDPRSAEHHLAAPADEPEDGLQGGRLADTVASEQRGDAGRGDIEGHALQDLLTADEGVQPADGEDAHTGSPRYAPCTTGSAITASGRSQASSRPWCSTATRSTSPRSTSRWCSTISTVHRCSWC